MLRPLVLSVALLTSSLSACAADWPVFRGDGRMTGAGTAKLPDPLEVRWTFKTGDGIEGAPAIADGVAYIASMDKHLYAVDLATGKEKWKAKLGPMKASPAVNGKLVVAGDVEGGVHGVDLATGTPLWKFATDGEITSGANFHKESILIGSHDAKLYCLTADGKKTWDFAIDGPVNGSPAVADGVTFVAGCDSVLHAVDIATGKELWNVDLGGQAAATAAVSGDFAYVGLMTNQVVAIDLKAKKKSWLFEPARRAQPFYASAAVTDDLVVTGSRDKKIYALDRKTGKEVWNFACEATVDASPVVVGGCVYIGCQSSTAEFYVLDLKTGKKLQELTLDSSVTGSVAVGPDCLLVGTEKGAVHCLGKK